MSRGWVIGAALILQCTTSSADENLFGYVKGAEPLPRGAVEVYAIATLREDKGVGDYEAWDIEAEVERGLTDRLAAAISLRGLAIDTSGLTIDGYLPKEESYGPKFSGVEGTLRYNFLSPAKHAVGVSLNWSLSYLTLDPHSGQDKDTLSFEQKLLVQKYLLDGQLILVGNLGFEGTRAEREPIENLPEDFDWPTDPEMELELSAAAGMTYRFAPNWFAGVEALYVQENETEVGLERWSVQAGPSVHYGSERWWATVTWLPQIQGGGEQYPDQPDDDLHLIEKTKQEYRFKFGYNF